MLLRLSLIVILISSSITYSFSQVTDTTSKAVIKKNDSIKHHSPKKAAIMSTILPGLGQIYNKKYWKVPVIYAGFVGLGIYFNYNQTRYVKYRDAYKYRVDGDSTTVDNYVGIYSDNALNDLQSNYHRYRDISLIGIGLLYIVNIIDASVDAHLFTFDVSDNLSMNIHPQLIYMTSCNRYQTSLSINLNFK